MARATITTTLPVVTLTLTLDEARLVRELTGKVHGDSALRAEAGRIFEELTKIPELKSRLYRIRFVDDAVQRAFAQQKIGGGAVSLYSE